MPPRNSGDKGTSTAWIRRDGTAAIKRAIIGSNQKFRIASASVRKVVQSPAEIDRLDASFQWRAFVRTFKRGMGGVDIEGQLWLIPMSKTGKPRRVPLSGAAVDVLNNIPRFEHCPYVVANPDTLRPYVTIKRAWQTARDEAKLHGLRLHDLRHAFCSAAVSAGVDLYAVGQIVGHSDHKSTMRYSHLASNTLLAAVEAGAKKMQGITRP